MLRSRPSKYIKTDVEPPVDGSVNGVVFIAKLLRRDILKKRFRFSTRPVFIGTCSSAVSLNLLFTRCILTTNVQRVDSTSPAIPRKNIGREY